MSRNMKHALAAAVVLAVVVPAYAGGKGGSSHGGHSYSGHYSGGYGHGYYHYGHYYYHGYRYYGAWPYGYFWYDPTFVATANYGVEDPVVPPTYEEPPPPPPPVPATKPAVVRIRTASGAKMWFDGSATTQTGELRTFTTPPLDDGKAYSYGVRACWLEDGRPVVRSRTVNVVAGRTIDVDMR
jgi:uncharacterized protein (TIGR03000 family)